MARYKNGEIPTTKRCVDCGEVKVRSEFRPRPSHSPNAVRPECKACGAQRDQLRVRPTWRDFSDEKKTRVKANNRRSQLKAKYGITPEDYDRMLAEQNGGCAVCGTTDPGGRHDDGRFMVDHNHATGAVRALLCTRCNLAVGALGDSAEIARAVAGYLTTHDTTGP